MATRDRRDVMPHYFTVDVEEYFHVSALEPFVPRSEWHAQPSRVAANVELVLELLERRGATATFFVLGIVAEAHPEMVRAIAEAGHEIASHGWAHRRVTTLTPDTFRESAVQSKRLLEDVTGTEVLGYRAPSFSITEGREWAIDVLIEAGYRYDSSLFPVKRNGYGYPSAARDPFRIERPSGSLVEYPPATVRRFGATLPAAGGGYMRLISHRLVRAALLESERRGVPATVYIHPWELDPDQPRYKVPFATGLRHYGGLRTMERRVDALLAEFPFRRIAEGLDETHLAEHGLRDLGTGVATMHPECGP